MDKVGAEIGVKDNDLSPWYTVEVKYLYKLGVSGLLRGHNNSVYTMLQKVYPEHEWLPWKFKPFPRSLSRDKSVVSKALKYVEKERKITQNEEWYRVSLNNLRELGVLSLISQAGGLYEVLKEHRPGFYWEAELLPEYKSSTRLKKLQNTSLN